MVGTVLLGSWFLAPTNFIACTIFFFKQESTANWKYCIVGTVLLGSWFQLTTIPFGSCIHPQFFEANIPWSTFENLSTKEGSCHNTGLFSAAASNFVSWCQAMGLILVGHSIRRRSLEVVMVACLQDGDGAAFRSFPLSPLYWFAC